MNIFKPESMSDLSHTQAVQHMRPFAARQDCAHYHDPVWVLAKRNNKKKITRVFRRAGKVINTTESYQ